MRMKQIYPKLTATENGFDISRVGPTVVVVMQPNRNLIVSVITETIRFRFGKWWNLKSSCSALQI